METFELLTTNEVARLLRVNPSTVRRWRLDGVGPRHIKIGGVYRYPRPLLAEWIDQRVRASVAS